MLKRTVLLAGSMLVGTTIGVVSAPATATAAPLLSACHSLGLGSVTTGVIQVAAQSDCYAFPGATGDRIRIRVVETLGLLFAQTRVLRPDGTEVCGRNVYRESTCVLDTTGTHHVRVGDDAGAALGNYSVNIQRLNDPMGCAVLGYGQTVSDSISVPAQTTCWRFSGVSGKTVRIRTQATYAIVNPETEVIRPDGSTVCPSATSWERTCTLDVTGTYTVLGKDNPGTGIGKYDLTLGCDTQPCSKAPALDFDGDRKSDIGVYRPTTGAWYVSRGAGAPLIVSWGGVAGDVPVAADYDGDGKADVAIYRPSTGMWYVSGSAVGTRVVNWGSAEDIPVPADYDGDGKADVAVYRPSTGMWHLSRSTGGTAIVNWGGVAGDVPVAADYDGDGKADVAIHRPSTGMWYVSGSVAGTKVVNWGGPQDIAVAADYDGDGKADVAVYRPATGMWYLDRTSRGTSIVNWGGGAADVPVPADYDGDGMADVGVYRPANGMWYLNGSTAGTMVVNWGVDGDRSMR